MQPDTLPLVAYAYVCRLMHANMHDSLLMRACLFVPLLPSECLCMCCDHTSAVRRVCCMAASLCYVCFSMAWATTFIFLVPSMSWSVLLAARVDCCSGSLSAECICDLCSRCRVMRRVATLRTSDMMARGRLVAHILLCLCCVCVFSGNFLRAAQLVRVYLSCWAWSDFPTGGGAPGLLCLAASMSTHPARHLQ
jgi:hypothetical protein